MAVSLAWGPSSSSSSTGAGMAGIAPTGTIARGLAPLPLTRHYSPYERYGRGWHGSGNGGATHPQAVMTTRAAQEW